MNFTFCCISVCLAEPRGHDKLLPWKGKKAFNVTEWVRTIYVHSLGSIVLIPIASCILEQFSLFLLCGNYFIHTGVYIFSSKIPLGSLFCKTFVERRYILSTQLNLFCYLQCLLKCYNFIDFISKIHIVEFHFGGVGWGCTSIRKKYYFIYMYVGHQYHPSVRA